MSSKLYKPMLAAKPDPAELDAAIAALHYPVFASPKLDGIRATVQGGKLLSRSLKLIPNLAMQKLWGRKEYEGLDGEIIVGDPFGEGVFDRTRRIVMKRTASAKDAKFYVFDSFTEAAPFDDRIFYDVGNRLKHLNPVQVVQVKQKLLRNEKELRVFEAEALKKGYEGICVRDPNGLYKQGRSTMREGGLVAIKRFTDAEATVLSVYEQMENQNAQEVNELGHAKRSSHAAGKVCKGTLGGFRVFAELGKVGVEFNIGTGVGLTDAYRKELWRQRKTLLGKIVKFRYQKIGTQDAPRLPIWLGWRDVIDM